MWSVWLVFCYCGFQSVCPLRERIRGLWKFPDGRDWLRGKLGLVLMGRAMLSKSLIQCFVDGHSCVPSLFFDLRPNYGEGNKDNGNLLQKVLCRHCFTQIWDVHKFTWNSPEDEWEKKYRIISWMGSQQRNVKTLKVLPWWFKAKTPCSKHK